jgi:hypothetical protein
VYAGAEEGVPVQLLIQAASHSQGSIDLLLRGESVLISAMAEKDKMSNFIFSEFLLYLSFKNISNPKNKRLGSPYRPEKEETEWTE